MRCGWSQRPEESLLFIISKGLNSIWHARRFKKESNHPRTRGLYRSNINQTVAHTVRVNRGCSSWWACSPETLTVSCMVMITVCVRVSLGVRVTLSPG